MRQILAITMLRFRLTLKNRATLVMMFAMPLLLTTIFGVLMQSGDSSEARVYPIAVVDKDGSFASTKLLSALQGDKSFKVRTVSEADLTKLFADRAVTASVIIPAGFQQSMSGGTPEVQFMTAPSGGQEGAIRPAVVREVMRVTNDYRLAQQTVANPVDETKVAEAFAKLSDDRKAVGVTVATETLVRKEVENKKTSNVGGQAIGFSVLFVMMVVFMHGGTILRERQDGTWGRLLTTPTTKLNVVAGYVLSFYVMGMFQFTVLILATSLLFGVTWGPLLPLAAVASAFVLCSAGMGLFLAGIVKTAEQQQTFGIVFVSATCMLGGVYWPLELVGGTMQRIGYLTPQAWAMDAFREVMLRGGSWTALASPLAVMFGLALVFMTAGLFRVRYE